MNTVKFQTISESQWDEIPVQKAAVSKPSPYDEMLQQVIDGSVVALPVDDEKDLRGIRIGIARRASKAFGVKLQFRYNSEKHVLAIRLESEKPESDTPRKPGRPPKKA